MLQVLTTADNGFDGQREKLKLFKFILPPDCTTADMQGGFVTIVEHFNLLHNGAW